MEIKNIRIIICTSDSNEMIKDSRQIKALANELNNKSESSFIIVEVVKTSQIEEYLGKLYESELVFLLFYDSVSKEQRKYFDRAVDVYKERKNPVVIPYIKFNDDIDNVTEEISDLQKYIGEELHLYYKSYNNSDALKLAVMLQLCQSGYVGLDFSIKDGRISYGAGEEIDTADIPMFANNDNLTSLKSTLAKLDKTLTGYFEDPTPEKQVKYKPILAKRSDIIRKITEAEKELFDKMRDFVSNTSGGNLDNDQIMAYRFMENGDVELALELLDSAVICEDLKTAEKTIEDAFDRMQKDIDKLCQRIDALDMMALSVETVKEKGQLFEEIRSYILKYPELYPAPLYRYAIFLKLHNNTELAFKVTQEYYSRVKDADSSAMALAMLLELSIRMGLYEKAKEYGNIILSDKASHPLNISEACYHLARIYQDEKSYAESERLYLRSVQIENEFVKLDPYRNDKLSAVYQCIATLYNDMCIADDGRNKDVYIGKALHYCEMSVSAARDMLKQEEHSVFKAGLAESLQALGTLYSNLGHSKEASQCFAESEEILNNLACTDPAAYEPKLASLYNGIAVLFGDTYFSGNRNNRIYFEQSREHYEKAISIYHRCILDGEKRFSLSLADTYENMGMLFYKDRNPEEAIICFERQTALIDAVKRDNNRELHRLSDLYERNGRIYAILKDEDKSMNSHAKAVMYSIKIAVREPDYITQLAFRLASTLDSILRLGSTDTAYGIINEFVANYCELARRGEFIYEERVGFLFAKLGDTALEREMLYDAVDYYAEALKFYEKIAREGDAASIVRAAEMSADIGTLLCGMPKDKKNGIAFYKKAFIYYRMLTEIDFHKYADDFISVARRTGIISLELTEEEDAYKYLMECIRACKDRLQHNPKDNLWVFTDCHYNLAKMFLTRDREAAKLHITVARDFCMQLKNIDEKAYNSMSPAISKLYDIIFSE